jgi:hypothetical protein
MADYGRAAIAIGVRLIICELSQTGHNSCSREFMLHYFWQLSLIMVKSVTVM